jgi:PAS domain S-box-containing protein
MAEPLRILILEDNPCDVELVHFELQEGEIIFTAKVVKSEQDFVRELQDFSPDLILSDYDIPKYNGALALAEAKRRCPDVPFILVTGAIVEDRAIEILTQGAKDYVLKNRLQQRLVPAVRRALAEAEERKARKQAEEELRKAHRTLEKRVKLRTEELEAEMAARKKMEEALWQAKDELEEMVQKRTRELEAASLYARNLIEASLDPLVTISMDGMIMDVNRASEEVTGIPRLQLIGSDFSDYFTEPEKARAGYKEVFLQGFVRDYPLQLKHRDGYVTPVLYNASVYRDETGQIAGVFAAARDITEHKQTEDALWKAYAELELRIEERTRELRRSEERLSLALKATRDGVWDWNIETGDIWYSDRYREILGYSAEKFETNFNAWLNLLHPQDREPARQGLEAILQGKREFEMTFRLRHRDGHHVNVISRGFAVRRVENGPIVRMVGTIQDLTGQKLSEEAREGRDY